MIGRRRFLIAAGALFATPLLGDLLASCAPPPPPTPSNTWTGLGLPTNGGTVVISQPVLMNTNPTLNKLTVTSGGVLVFDPDIHRTLTMNNGNVIVNGNGRLTMRPNNRNWHHRIKFINVNESAYQGGGMSPVDSDVGLWCMDQGLLDFVGPDMTPWVRTAGSISQGATQAGVNTPPNLWQSGDEILIAPMRTNPDEFEIKSFSSLNGNTVAWSGGTSFPHPISPILNNAGKRFGTELCNLSRNVHVEGTPSGRAHCFIRTTVPQNLTGVEFRYMGPNQPDGFNGTPAVVLGRYALHFHHCMNGTRTSWMIGCVVRDCGSHAFIAHASNAINFVKCISHNTMTDAYWWDHPFDDPTAASDDVKYDSCVVSRCYPDGNNFKFTNAGYRTDLGNNNTMTGCVAFGCPSSAGVRWEADSESVWNFDGFVSHSNSEGAAVWQNDGEPHTINNSFFFNNGTGLSLGAYGNSYHVNSCGFAGNGEQVAIAAVSDPSQNGQQWNNLYVDAMNQSHCMVFPAGSPVGNGGGAHVNDCIFKNSAGSGLFLEKGHGVHDGGAVVFVDNCTFINSSPQTQVASDITQGAHFVVT